MKYLHQSRQSRYRHPYGALPALSRVELAISLTPEAQDQEDVHNVFLCYAYGLHRFYESRQRLLPRNTLVPEAPAKGLSDEPDTQDYATVLTLPAEPGLFFYWFEIQFSGNRLYYTSDLYGNGSGWIGHQHPHVNPGEAHHPHPFQITVVDPDFTVPSWMIGGVLYQIFPDRFHRDRLFTTDRFHLPDVDRQERIFHEDWTEDVDFKGRPETGYQALDFYGGSLRGIVEKLDYIRSLGVNVIYLNPIFEARSNHRYDTADYEKIDPLLGTNADLTALCREADQRGIRVVLDGVFSHTGADSRYFNKFGRYPGIGAFQEMSGNGISPYTDWYTFHRQGDDLFYDSWWGFLDLPNVNEHDLGYREYIAGSNGILRTWLKRGVSGFRLDVADELPDLFLREIRRVVRSEKQDATIIGEVWEDASHKVSYGQYRDFLVGSTHDSIMGYPFQAALLDWLGQKRSGTSMINALESLRENYPIESFYSSMNLISSHDVPRAITTLAGLPDPVSRDAQARTHLSRSARLRGVALMRLAYLFQIAFPGLAAIYYGDEVGVEGYRDPFNRRTYPWGREDSSLLDWYRQIGQLRWQLPALRTGLVRLSELASHVIQIERYLDLGRDAFGRFVSGPDHVRVVINRSGQAVTVLWQGRELTLQPYGSVIRFGDTEIVNQGLADLQALQDAPADMI